MPALSALRSRKRRWHSINKESILVTELGEIKQEYASRVCVNKLELAVL